MFRMSCVKRSRTSSSTVWIAPHLATSCGISWIGQWTSSKTSSTRDVSMPTPSPGSLSTPSKSYRQGVFLLATAGLCLAHRAKLLLFGGWSVRWAVRHPCRKAAVQVAVVSKSLCNLFRINMYAGHSQLCSLLLTILAESQSQPG